MRTIRLLTAAASIIAGALVTAPCSAQQHHKAHRLSVLASTGSIFGGPSEKLSGELAAQGWDEASPNICIFDDLFCATAEYYPKPVNAGNAGSFFVRYSV